MSRLLRFIAVFSLALPFAGALTPHASAAEGPLISVYKSPACGCCGAWVEHLRKSGFDTRVMDVPDVSPFKRKFGVPEALTSCHTAVVAGYTIEGHVPAADIRRLLRERPSGRGIAVPAMPLGSPGMPGPRKDPFETLLFDASGGYVVYQRH